jgi:hypothetical protein
MRKIQTVGLALVAVLAMSAVAVASASAAEWLLNGAKITAATSAPSEGALTLEDTKAPGGAVKVECSGKFVGTVGPLAADSITEVLSLTGTSTISCTIITHGACEGTTAEVKGIHLPWTTELLLATETEFRDDIVSGTGGEPGYTVVCKTILGNVTDTCTGKTSSEELNVTGGVEGIFEAKSEKANCSLGGTGSGVILGKGISKTASGTLTVSE